MVELIRRENEGVFRSTRAMQTAINSYIYSIVIQYNHDIPNMRGHNITDTVFEWARLFPIHTLEWCFANLEFATQYRKELGWVGDVIVAKTLKAIKKRYMGFSSEKVENKALAMQMEKQNDWNTSIIEVLREMLEKSSYKRGLKVIREIIEDVARKSWGSKDINEIEETCMKVEKMDMSYRSKVGFLFFSITGDIVVKGKEDEGPYLLNGDILYPNVP